MVGGIRNIFLEGIGVGPHQAQTPGTLCGSEAQEPEPPWPAAATGAFELLAQDPQVSPDGQATTEGESLPDEESPSPRHSLATPALGGKCPTSK